MIQTHLRRFFPQERIARMINDLCEANDVRSSQFGMFKTPNWMARHKGLKEVMEMLAATPGARSGAAQPTKMVFNIISNSPVKVEKKAS